VVFGEGSARLLLLAHTVLAVGCVAASTHLVVWMRRWRKGEFTRVRAVRRFAWIALALWAATFALGNLAYPSYRVSVRAQFLDNPSEVTREAAARAEARRKLETFYGDRVPGEASAVEKPSEGPARRAAKISRWFDVKEHWVSLGLALTLGLALMLTAWDPRRETAVLGPIAFWLATAAAGAAWLGAIIGLVVSSYRAVGPL
jgi:hypothetical protein